MNLIIFLLTNPIDSIWSDPFFYLFIGMSLVFLTHLIISTNSHKLKNNKINLLQQQHTAKLDSITKNYSEKNEKLRIEMLIKEEERTRQWMESEKETLQVLNGVSQLLELSENIGRIESEKILNSISEIKTIINKN